MLSRSDVFRLRRRISDCGFRKGRSGGVQGERSHRNQTRRLIKKPAQVVVSGGFDDMRSRDMRFLEEAAKLGELTVLLRPDAVLERLTGKAPKFPFGERKYFLDAIRYVSKVVEAEGSADCDSLPRTLSVDVWADRQGTANREREQYARDNNISYRVFSCENLNG